MLVGPEGLDHGRVPDEERVGLRNGLRGRAEAMCCHDGKVWQPVLWHEVSHDRSPAVVAYPLCEAHDKPERCQRRMGLRSAHAVPPVCPQEDARAARQRRVLPVHGAGLHVTSPWGRTHSRGQRENPRGNPGRALVIEQRRTGGVHTLAGIGVLPVGAQDGGEGLLIHIFYSSKGSICPI